MTLLHGRLSFSGGGFSGRLGLRDSGDRLRLNVSGWLILSSGEWLRLNGSDG